jgi:hypothetical protein
MFAYFNTVASQDDSCINILITVQKVKLLKQTMEMYWERAAHPENKL